MKKVIVVLFPLLLTQLSSDWLSCLLHGGGGGGYTHSQSYVPQMSTSGIPALTDRVFFPFPFILSQLSVWLSYCTHSWPPSSTVTVHIKYFLIRVWNEANDVLDVPASLLQLTGSSSLGLAWKVETPTIRRRKKKMGFFPPCIKCAANRRPKIDYKKTPQNYTSICWGAEAIFLPFLSTTTADTVVWPMETPFTKKTAVSLSVDSTNGLQRRHSETKK